MTSSEPRADGSRGSRSPRNPKMSKDPRQRWGPALAAIRTQKGLTRAELIKACWREAARLNAVHLYDKVPTEQLLSRIESGQAIRVDRQMLELIFRANNCSPDERMRVLMLAGCTVIANDQSEPAEEAQLLNQAMESLYNIPEARESIVALMRQRKADNAAPNGEGEVLEILWAVLDLVVSRQRGEKPEEIQLLYQALESLDAIPGARETIVATMRQRKQGVAAFQDVGAVWEILWSVLDPVVRQRRGKE